MSQQIYQYGASRAVTNGYQLSLSPGTLYRVDGYCTGAAGANCWLQFFDAVAAPATNDVPKKSFFINEANGFSYTLLKEDMVSFTTGIYLALSKDSTKFVAVTDGATVSGDATIEDLSIILGATLVSVPDMSAVSGFADIWTQAQSPHTLVQVKVTNAAPASTKTWLVICATTLNDSDALPIEYIPLFRATTTAGVVTITNLSPTIRFGVEGLSFPTNKYGAVIANGLATGCGLFITDTANPQANPSGNNIRSSDATAISAYYR